MTDYIPSKYTTHFYLAGIVAGYAGHALTWWAALIVLGCSGVFAAALEWKVEVRK